MLYRSCVSHQCMSQHTNVAIKFPAMEYSRGAVARARTGLVNDLGDEKVTVVGLRRRFEGFAPIDSLFNLVPTEDVRGR